ncbi:hypothetical protein Vadar_005814 [Vaccinium darrowii]|uniref:Uncharacterized protein n=1 Tax=Vaccinium darrowii TaxID=229202 RepID=A0ACB7X8H3_9ERIC|nr:hypothetical protein Vadar_005814 [Vaccinium darrowii]
MEEESTTLKLIIEKGPREGETLEFQHGSVIRIGRIVRGNTLAIKDAGISTKHLSIVSSTSPSFKWLITDLDSSNGTALNGSTLTPLVPSDLQNGDVIKLGEYTSIKVSIEAAHVGGVASRLRRNPKRGGSKAKERGDSELGLGFGVEFGNVVENPRRVRPPKKGKVVKSDSRDSICEIVNVEESPPSEPKQGRRVNTRVTRSSKNKESCNQEAEVSAQVVDRKTRGGRGRGRKKNLRHEPLESVKDEGLDEKEEEECEIVEEKVGDKVNSGKAGNEGQEDEIIGKLAEEPTRRKVSLEGVPLENVKNDILGEKGEGCEKVEESLSNRQWEAVRGGIVEDGGPDLEKMTLEEWFDYLEEYLPKQIRDETEEMILQMNQRAEQVQKFILKQRSDKEKGKQTVG